MFKKLISAALAVCLVLGVSSSFAQDSGKAKGMSKGSEKGIIIINGKVTGVKGNTITVKDDAGRERTLDVKDAGGIKAGDTVNVKDGIVEKAMTGDIWGHK